MRRNELSLIDNLFGKSLFSPSWLDVGIFPSVLPSMRMDVKELENSYEVVMDVPGIPKENIKIEVEDGYLTVSAKVENKEETKEDGVYIRRERSTSSQTQKIYVGDIREEDVKASVKDGVLNITIAKPEEAKPKKTTINIE